MRSRSLTTMAIIGALLASGLLVGVSRGADRIDTPQVFALREGKVLATDGGQIKKLLRDQDGVEVGAILWDCTNGVAWTCTNHVMLRDGDVTDAGAIVVSGIFRGFNGERLAVTGGTGAYQGVGGYVQLTVVDGRYTHTLHLLP